MSQRNHPPNGGLIGSDAPQDRIFQRGKTGVLSQDEVGATVRAVLPAVHAIHGERRSESKRELRNWLPRVVAIVDGLSLLNRRFVPSQPTCSRRFSKTYHRRSQDEGSPTIDSIERKSRRVASQTQARSCQYCPRSDKLSSGATVASLTTSRHTEGCGGRHNLLPTFTHHPKHPPPQPILRTVAGTPRV